MQISGIGGFGMGCGFGVAPAAGAAIESAGAIAAGGGTASIGDVASPSQTLPPAMQALQELLHDFTSAEILLLLMLMSSAKRKDGEGCGGDAALGLLAGLALTGQLGQQPLTEWTLPVPAAPAADASTQLDLHV